MKRQTIAGVLTRYNEDKDGCWIYDGYLNDDGYGATSINYEKVLLHRLSYREHHGPLIDGMMVCHTCDKPACFNPKHLYQGTALENNRDRAARNKDGPLKYQTHMAAQVGLDADAVRAIYCSDEPTATLAEKYAISKAVVQGIRAGRKYTRMIDDASTEWRKDNPFKPYARTAEWRKAASERAKKLNSGFKPSPRTD